jgi:hypothetical protein
VDGPAAAVTAVLQAADLLGDEPASPKRHRVHGARPQAAAVVLAVACQPLDAAAPHAAEDHPEPDTVDAAILVVLTVLEGGRHDDIPQMTVGRALLRPSRVRKHTRWRS